MSGDILFDLFGTLSSFLVKVGTPVLIMTGGLVVIALIVKLRRRGQ